MKVPEYYDSYIIVTLNSLLTKSKTKTWLELTTYIYMYLVYTKTVDSVFSRALIGYSISEYPVLFTDSPPVPMNERHQPLFSFFFLSEFPDHWPQQRRPTTGKVFIPDSMPQATVQYDEEAMVIHVKDPSLGWVARVEVVRDTPYAPQVIQVKNNRETRLGHTELE